MTEILGAEADFGTSEEVDRSLPSSEQRLANRIARKLGSLIAEADDPECEMSETEDTLERHGLWMGGFSKGYPSPQMFAIFVIAENPLVLERLSLMERIFRPESSETPGDLVSEILPSDGLD